MWDEWLVYKYPCTVVFQNFSCVGVNFVMPIHSTTCQVLTLIQCQFFMLNISWTIHITHEISLQWIRFDFMLSDIIFEPPTVFRSNITDACDHAVTIWNGLVFRQGRSRSKIVTTSSKLPLRINYMIKFNVIRRENRLMMGAISVFSLPNLIFALWITHCNQHTELLNKLPLSVPVTV